jgi:hypothetical protein
MLRHHDRVRVGVEVLDREALRGKNALIEVLKCLEELTLSLHREHVASATVPVKKRGAVGEVVAKSGLERPPNVAADDVAATRSLGNWCTVGVDVDALARHASRAEEVRRKEAKASTDLVCGMIEPDMDKVGGNASVQLVLGRGDRGHVHGVRSGGGSGRMS